MDLENALPEGGVGGGVGLLIYTLVFNNDQITSGCIEVDNMSRLA